MRHLSADRLAALADEHPTAEETLHLAACGECCATRESHRRLASLAAGERLHIAPPLSSWGAIAAQLRAEGLVRTPEATDAASPPGATADPAGDTKVVPLHGAGTPARRGWRVPAWAPRIAAAAVLLLGGVAAGRASAGGSLLPARFASVTNDTGTTASTMPEGPGGTSFAGNIGNAPAPLGFRSVAHARLEMAAAEKTYQAALLYLARHDSTAVTDTDPVDVYRTRLAALDEVMATTQQALNAAPHDPVINGYYMTTVGAREATLRQLDEALPVSSRLTRF